MTLRVLNAHEMLAAGKMQRVAEATAPASSDAGADSDAGHQQEPVIRIGEDLPQGPDTAFDSAGRPILDSASSTLRHAQTLSDDEESYNRAPCTVAYLQVIATRSGVRIPRNADCHASDPTRSLVGRAWRALRSAYYDRLAWDAGMHCDTPLFSSSSSASSTSGEGKRVRTTETDEAGHSVTIEAPVLGSDEGARPPILPIMLAFEPLLLGLIPSTAAYMLFLLLVVLALTKSLVLPRVSAHFDGLVAAAPERREKTE